MKSKLSCALGAILLSTTALASAPKGFYGGGDISVSLANLDLHLDTKNDADDFGYIRLPQKKKALTFRVFSGYQTPVRQDCFFAGEFFVGPKDYTHKIKGINIADPDSGNTVYQNVRLKIERKVTLGTGIKFGRYFDHKTAVYAGLSLSGANMEVSFSDADGNDTANGKDKKFLVGVAPSVGLIRHITPKDRIHVGYSYEKQFKWKSKSMDSDPDYHFKTHLTTGTHNFTISYSKFF